MGDRLSWVRQGAGGLAIAAVLAVSMLPLPLKRALGTTGRWHSPGHFVAFLTISVLLLLPARTSHLRTLLAGLVVLLAGGIEELQHWIYRNPFEWRDFVTDTLAVAAAVTVIRSGLFRRWTDFDGETGA